MVDSSKPCAGLYRIGINRFSGMSSVRIPHSLRSVLFRRLPLTQVREAQQVGRSRLIHPLWESHPLYTPFSTVRQDQKQLPR